MTMPADEQLVKDENEVTGISLVKHPEFGRLTRRELAIYEAGRDQFAIERMEVVRNVIVVTTFMVIATILAVVMLA